MKILSVPHNKPEIIFHDPCGAKLEVEPSDIQQTYSDDDGRYYVFQCANCGKQIWRHTHLFKWNLP